MQIAARCAPEGKMATEKKLSERQNNIVKYIEALYRDGILI